MATPPPPEPPPERSTGPDVGGGPPEGPGSRRRNGRSLVIGGAIAVIAVAAGAVAIALVVVGDDEEAAGCLPSLDVPMPDGGLIVGSDLERARSMVDEPPGPRWEDALDFNAATGAAVDPLSVAASSATFGDPSDDVGYDWSDIDCWIGGPGRMVARGSFDEERMAAADELGWDVALDGDVLTYTHGRDGDAPEGDGGDPPPVDDVLDVLYRNDVVSFQAWADTEEPGADAVWTTWGVAEGEGPELLMVWAFRTEDDAAEGAPTARRVLGGESAVGDLIEGDPAELLARDGSTLVLRAPLTGAVTSLSRLTGEPDPALLMFWD